MTETVKSILRYYRQSPSKVSLVGALIRGKKISESQAILSLTKKRAARTLLKVLNSAVANAKANKGWREADLRIKTVLVNPGPVLKRGLPVSRGRWHPILKRSSHLTVELEKVEVQEKGK